MKIFALGMGSGVAVYLLAVKGPQEMLKSIVGGVLSAARNIPGVGGVLDQAEVDALRGIMDDIAPIDPNAMTEISATGLSADLIAQEVKNGLAKDVSHGFNEGKSFAGIYHYPNSPLSILQAEVMKECLNTNQIYPGVFKFCKKMESEAVVVVVNMLKGKLGLSNDLTVDPAPDACGILSSGGTESILLAVKSYRDAFLESYGGNSQFSIVPEVIAGITCHPALDKACEYLRIKLHKLPVNHQTYELEASIVEKFINNKTIFIYASAPTFPHGVVDPIPELAALAQKYSIGLHVDNCLGGILLSYAYAVQQQQKQGSSNNNSPSFVLNKIPAFDFRVPGVTSISTDIHKYGYAPKGASVIAFRNQLQRRFVYSVVTDWPGGLYTTPTSSGSRSGANAATAWATLRYMGGEGYQSMAELNQSLLNQLYHAISSIPSLTIVGNTQASIIAFTTNNQIAKFHIYALAARMEKKGFHVNSLQSPPAVMVCVSERMSSFLTEWIAALQECVQEAMANPKDPEFEGKGEAGIYGAAAVLPAKELGRILKRYCDILYLVRKN